MNVDQSNVLERLGQVEAADVGRVFRVPPESQPRDASEGDDGRDQRIVRSSVPS